MCQIDFVECDFICLLLCNVVFDVVYCLGVFYYMLDLCVVFVGVVKVVKLGGYILLGFYNCYVCLLLWLCCLIVWVMGYCWILFDLVLCDCKVELVWCEVWLCDQYWYFEEYRYSLVEVCCWFQDEDIDFIFIYFLMLIGYEFEDLFMLVEDEWLFELLFVQIGWMWSFGGEGGLFVVVGRCC